jgi:hypothetical protein
VALGKRVQLPPVTPQGDTMDWYSSYKKFLSAKHGVDMTINMNDMARLVAKKEQGDEVNIAQIKEVLRIFLEELSRYRKEDVLEVVKRYRR